MSDYSGTLTMRFEDEVREVPARRSRTSGTPRGRRGRP